MRDAAGTLSAVGIMQLLGQAGLRAQRSSGRSDPQMVFQRAIDEALEAGEVGIQLAVYKDGELVVDVFGGIADPATGRAVDSETLFNVFSVTKAITATALHIQAERGHVAYDAPIAQYWPEFGAHGKDRATVTEALNHRTGLPAMPDGVTPEQMADYDWMVEALANMEPMYEPGTTNAYHSYTWGWIVAEIVERTDPQRRPFRQFVADEIATPLAIDDLWMGLPPEDEPRVATMVNSHTSIADQSTLRGQTMPAAVAGTEEIFGRSIIRQAVIPGAGGIYKATSVARFFALLAGEGELDGVRLLSRQRVNDCLTLRPDTHEVDVAGGNVRLVTNGGYWLDAPGVVGGNRILSHPGLGGSIGWADLDHDLAVSMCHNRHGLAYAEPLADAMRDAFGVTDA